MKKILCFIASLIFISCSSSKHLSSSNEKKGRFEIDENHITIITPYVEIMEKHGLSFIKQPAKRNDLMNFTRQTLQSAYPKAKYHKVQLLFRDYRTINAVLERPVNYSPETVPFQLLSYKNEKSLFISINGYFGDLNRGILMLYVINNKKQKWKMIERFEYNVSPLDTVKTKKRILKALEKLK